LERLSGRISELKTEILDAKNSLKSLHKEKIRLEKERSLQKEKIETWTDKCHELQMLKFGRLIDLDVLEAGSDRTKEREGEIAITEQEMIHQAEMKKLMDEYELLKSEYAEVTFTPLLPFSLNAGDSNQHGLSAIHRHLHRSEAPNLPRDERPFVRQ
jgi:hypothetical protein